MSDLKKLTQAYHTIAQFMHEPGDTENSNRFKLLQDRVLFNICDTLAGNVHWIVNTGLPSAQRGVAYAERSSHGVEIDLLEVDKAKAKLATMKDQLMLADSALDQAMDVYTRYTGEDYAWVPYADRNKSAVKSTETDAAEAVLAKMRAKHGIKAK